MWGLPVMVVIGLVVAGWWDVETGVQVVALDADIGAYEQIQKDDLTVIEVSDAGEATGFSDPDSVEGRITQEALESGDIVPKEEVTGQVDVDTFEDLDLVMALQLEQAAILGVKPGDPVDVLLAPTTQGEFETTVVSGALLLDQTTADDGIEIVLAVNEAQRADIIALGGRAQVTLAPAYDP